MEAETKQGQQGNSRIGQETAVDGIVSFATGGSGAQVSFDIFKRHKSLECWWVLLLSAHPYIRQQSLPFRWCSTMLVGSPVQLRNHASVYHSHLSLATRAAASSRGIFYDTWPRHETPTLQRAITHLITISQWRFLLAADCSHHAIACMFSCFAYVESWRTWTLASKTLAPD